jgi:ATP-dependent helicase/nuclease subunit B
MRIVFGMSLDEEPWPMESAPTQGVFYAGPSGLLKHLEAWLGCAGYQPVDEYLRIEQYRQILHTFAEKNCEAFFREAFQADPFATATALLEFRDELLLSGWDFSEEVAMPARLRVLAQLEAEANYNRTLLPGFGDRIAQVLRLLPHRTHPVREVEIVEPSHLLPLWCNRIWNGLSQTGVTITYIPELVPSAGSSDLYKFQQSLVNSFDEGQSSALRKRVKQPLSGDGSLLLLRARRDSDMAAWAATFFRKNSTFKPLLFIPDRGRLLDLVLREEGLPGLGLRSASEARPVLQVLKLAPDFLWTPVDPFRIMEFVSLSIKPLEDGLAIAIAEQLAQRPGLQGENWGIAVHKYLAEVESGESASNKDVTPDELRRQYKFWFERKRYDASSIAPKADAMALYIEIEKWAEHNLDSSPGFSALLEQTKRILALLEALPETHLTPLELERIVKTVLEPTALQILPRAQGHLPFVSRPGSILAQTEDLFWWNFTQKEPDHFFSRWYNPELEWLAVRGFVMESPGLKNERLLWQRRRPVMAAQNRLMLVLPDTCDGEEVSAHPLMGDLMATFTGLDAITLHLDAGDAPKSWSAHFHLPIFDALESKSLHPPRPFLYLKPERGLQARERETFSSLDALLYYPYQWVFRYKVKLYKSPILSLASEDALLGNLAHRIFEKIFRLDTADWTREHVEQWFREHAGMLLAREGAVLLLYGREPERIAFLNRVKQAAWNLIHLLRENGWQVEAVEAKLDGELTGVPFHGRADMMLKRGKERAILDLKWSGLTYRTGQIRNETDIQLALYARLAGDGSTLAHTAFYIMEQPRVLARNNGVFKEIISLVPGSDHLEIHSRMLARIENTYRWRLDQLQDGKIEVRCAKTSEALQDFYGSQLLDVLEPPREDAKFDDYRVLIGQVE